MNSLVSVIIPSYNPNSERLNQTLMGLQRQTLSVEKWELIIIDNNSSPAINTDLSWHDNGKIIKETKQGLTYARLAGFAAAKNDIIVMVDDDNVLDENYLENVLTLFNTDKHLGAAGGKSLPLFETTPPIWLTPFYGSLALRDLGGEVLLAEWQNAYPTCAPIGAGMAIRKDALGHYMANAVTNAKPIADRTENQLTSGGDNDIVLEILKSGWKVGYFPSLTLKHIIPASRMEVDYVARLVNNTNRSWMQVLRKHEINPWSKIPVWTLGLRKAKAWFKYKPFLSKTNYINWRGACGQFDGLAEIS